MQHSLLLQHNVPPLSNNFLSISTCKYIFFSLSLLFKISYLFKSKVEVEDHIVQLIMGSVQKITWQMICNK